MKQHLIGINCIKPIDLRQSESKAATDKEFVQRVKNKGCCQSYEKKLKT